MNKTNTSGFSNAVNSTTQHTNSVPDGYTSVHHQHNNEDILKVTKMIGQLPIAEYEGSPRRFGNQPLGNTKQAGTCALPKRPPGFPQRVSPIAGTQQHTSIQQQLMQQEVNSRSTQCAQRILQQQQQQHYYPTTPTSVTAITTVAIGLNNCRDNKSVGHLIDIDERSTPGIDGTQVKTPTFDYLYECSETRKVLEDFFKANSEDEKRFTDYTESGDDVGSCVCYF